MRRTWFRGMLAVLAAGALLACESSTDVETPTLRTGANAELAIQLPPVYPPLPRRAILYTEFRVIQSTKIWFQNLEEPPLTVSAWVTDPDTDERTRVGRYELKSYATAPLTLDAAYATQEYREHEWTLTIQTRTTSNETVLGFD